MATDETAPYHGFTGRIGRTMAGSEPAWPPGPQWPSGAPNIVFVLVDDVGFSDLGCYGSEIHTPHLDRLADEGVRCTSFHVTPMCSPTRAALLTGLNPHHAGMGHIAQDDPGYPGYRAELAEDAVTVAETLRANGYATFMAGKWHLCRDSDMSAAGPMHSWPLQRGFDRFVGILEAFTNLHQPHRLVEDNHVIDVEHHRTGYFLTDDLTERAIRMIRERAASRPGQPFFLYLAHPAAHAPLMAKPDDIERYRDAYDCGWDEIRRRRHARQLELGVIPPGTLLPPRNSEPGDEVRPWDELSDVERTLFARYMAVYAAMIDEIDQSVGRLRAALEEMGEWDNTVLVFLSDNGASREGEATGSTNYYAHLAGGPDTVDIDVLRLDDIGSPRTMSHYPRGWAMASNTPFRLYKRNTHAGGHQVPCIWSWPRGQRDGRLGTGLRHQYAHGIDVVPTVLEWAGITPLAERNGRVAKALDGTSLAGVLADADHREVRHEQYYELEGHRGMYADGWEVVSNRRPRTPFGDHEWELYHLETDPTELHDRAGELLDLVAELSSAWDREARRNQVYPLDEGSGWRWIVRPPKDQVFGEPVTIWPGTPTLERIRCGALVWQRSFTIEIDATLVEGDHGVLVSHGDQGGGYSVEIDAGRLWFVHNDGHGHTLTHPWGTIAPGHHRLLASFGAPGGGRWHVGATLDGHSCGDPVDVAMLWPIAPFQGIAIGIDRGSPVCWSRSLRHGAFPFSGRLGWVRYEPGEPAPDAPERFLELLREIGAKCE